MNKDTIRQASNIFALVAVVVFNFASQAFELNGNTNDAVANRYDILYFPANWAFSIWGVIYTFLIAWVIYQALPSQRENPLHRKIGYWFVIISAANIGWITAFHYEQFPLSMLMMLVLLVSLVVIFVRLGIGHVTVSRRDKWLVHVPFSIYLGWITAATVTNATYVLYDAGYRESLLGISAEMWTVLLLIISAALAISMLVTRRDAAYALVIVWAVVAIGARYTDIALIATSAFAAAAIIVLALAGNLLIRQRSSNNSAFA